MFWSKKPDPKPLGVHLDDLLLMLKPTSIKASRDGNAIIARHEHFTTRVEVIPPESRESENGPIRAVVRIKTDLPQPLQKIFESAEAMSAFNSMAALGALTTERGNTYVGSRLTIYDADDDSWRNLHLPLLMFTTISGAEAILGGIRRTLTNEDGRGGASAWTSDDMDLVQQYLSDLCVCTAGGLGFTAEFGLAEGMVTAATGDHKTALFQLLADQPHPELGGGLFCLLQMPHQVGDQNRLRQVCSQLNTMEMQAHDLPPHFGAWCEGRLDNNPAYVSFLPNAMRMVNGIAVNAAFWAINRAHWANAMLASLGIRA